MRGSVKRLVRVSVCASVWFCVPTNALGQTPPAAKDLFEQAQEPLSEGDYAVACPLLQQSYDLDPKLGCLYALGLCRDGEQRSATALALYQEYLTSVAKLDDSERAKHADRVAKAVARVDVLNKEVPRLKLVWRSEIPQGIDVRVDGRDALAKLNTEWPLDPGEHIITVRRKETGDESETIKLENGQPTVERDLTPKQEVPVKVEESPSKPPVPVVQTPTQPPKPEPKSSYVFSQRTLGRIWLGVAGAGVITAGAFGIKAAMQKSAIGESCPLVDSKFQCNAAGGVALDEGFAWGNAASWALVASGAVALVGIVELRRGMQQEKSSQVTRMRFGADSGRGFVMVEGRF